MNFQVLMMLPHISVNWQNLLPHCIIYIVSQQTYQGRSQDFYEGDPGCIVRSICSTVKFCKRYRAEENASDSEYGD